jgi:XisI protein
MDNLDRDRTIICAVLTEQTNIPYSYGEIRYETIFDRTQDRYVVMILGREPARHLSETATRRVHGCLIHVDIIDSMIWIQRDGTEEGVAIALMKAGIPREKIVLGFRSPQLREDSEFAIR